MKTQARKISMLDAKMGSLRWFERVEANFCSRDACMVAGLTVVVLFLVQLWTSDAQGEETGGPADGDE
jgi:hypothetical protein